MFFQVTITIGDVGDAKMSRGIVLALMSAVFYAAYLVLVKHKSDTDEKINIPFFFGERNFVFIFLFPLIY